jgi:hypothetical protein
MGVCVDTPIWFSLQDNIFSAFRRVLFESDVYIPDRKCLGRAGFPLLRSHSNFVPFVAPFAVVADNSNGAVSLNAFKEAIG